MIERGGVGAEVVTHLLETLTKMWPWWPQVRNGALPGSTFQKRMLCVRRRVSRLLRDARVRAERKTADPCLEILLLESALWTFFDHAGIEPTNNAAERATRPAVLLHEGSCGKAAAVGSRFSERLLAGVATVRLHDVSPLRSLTEACSPYR